MSNMESSKLPQVTCTSEPAPVDHEPRPYRTYAFYGGSIVLLCALTVAFWAWSAITPIIYPLQFGLWLKAHPKSATILWTSCGSLLSALTLHLLNQILHLMVKQRIQTSTTLSTIEGWSKLSNHKYFFDRRSPWLTTFTVATWAVATLLTTAYTTLLTPTNILTTESITGSEIDFQSDEWAQWWWHSKKNDFVCDWVTYTSKTGSIKYPMCLAIQDPVTFISSGIMNALASLGNPNSFIGISDSLFNGTTGGVLPLGWGGIQAFNDVNFTNPGRHDLGLNFNYSLIQQGYSTDVDCEPTSDSPIIRTQIMAPVNVTNSFDGSQMVLHNYSYVNSDCTGDFTNAHSYFTPSKQSMGSFLCQPGTSRNLLTLYLRPFGAYERFFPNLTCSLQPYYTVNNVSYSSTTGIFNTTRLSRLPPTVELPLSTSLEFEQLLLSSITPEASTKSSPCFGNIFVDSLLDLNATVTSAGDEERSFNVTALMEAAIRGIYEYKGTHMRIRYTGQGATRLRSVHGSFTSWRVGYDGQKLSLAITLPMLVFILGSAAYYCISGLSCSHGASVAWNPMSVTSWITAGTAGGAPGAFEELGDKKGRSSYGGPGTKTLKVKYSRESGLIADFGRPSTGSDAMSTVEEGSQGLAEKDGLLIGYEEKPAPPAPSYESLTPRPFSHSFRTPSYESLTPRPFSHSFRMPTSSTTSTYY
ncbi:uncharacterized protein BKA78DRAFT_297585 [Phyllosticta capitalensis]|uniref:uncharacterized protein n=1 Tax=Phyllosticta capitalensis TaxID=121624 RepID=UPI00312EF3EA